MTTSQDLLGSFNEAEWTESAGEEVVRLPTESLREFAEVAREAGFRD